MGFIPLPLGVLATRIVSQAVQITNFGGAVVLFFAFLCLVSFRTLSNIVTLGKACDLIDAHQKQRANANATNMASSGTRIKTTSCFLHAEKTPLTIPNLAGAAPGPSVSASPRVSRPEKRSSLSEDGDGKAKGELFPEPPVTFTRSMSIDVSQLSTVPDRDDSQTSSAPVKIRSVSHSPPRITRRSVLERRGRRTATPPQIPPLIPELGCQPMFSNSTVSLTSICLNEEIFDEDLDQTLVDHRQSKADKSVALAEKHV